LGPAWLQSIAKAYRCNAPPSRIPRPVDLLLPPLVLPHLVPVVPALYRYLARSVVAVAEGLRDPLVYPLYTLDGLMDPLQLLKLFSNETVTYLLPLTLSFIMA